MPVIDIEGVPVHYAARGSGDRAVVFVHGGFGSSSELWDCAMAALPSGWRGIAVDNFLRSGPPPEGYNVQAFARRLRLLVDALELDRPVITGHSMGGVVCQLAAASAPHRYGAAVLVCTGPAMTQHQLARDLLEDLRRHGSARLRAISEHWFRRVDAGFFDAYVQRACEAPLQAMLDVQASLIEIDCRPLLARITAPTLVVFGAYDTGRTRAHADALLAGIAGSRLAVMHDSGHSPMVETPDDFHAALHGFLATLPEPSRADPVSDS